MEGRIRRAVAAASLVAAVPLCQAAPATQPAQQAAPATQPADAAPLAVPATQPAAAEPQAPATPPARAKKKKKADPPAAAPSSSAEPTAAAPDEPPARLSFDTDKAVVWLDGTQVLPFRVDRPVDRDRTFPANVKAEGDQNPRLEVVREPQVLAGETLGFLRVRAAGEGRARLTLGPKDAAATLYIDAMPSPAAAEVRQTAPTIVSPADGAVVWGTVGVSVEVFSPGDAPGEVSLVTPGGERVYPVEQTDPDAGPLYQFGFTLDTDAFEPGTLTLFAAADVSDIPDAAPLEGGAITLHVHRPGEGDLLQGEAEDRADAPRPERYAATKATDDPQPPLKLGEGKDASGGRFVDNAGSRPALVLRLAPDEGGWYQVIMTARGDDSLGVLPTVGLHLNNDDNDPRTASAIALHDWHRTPIGRPIFVKKGEQDLVVLFENDESSGKGEDRNLYLDRYEVARLPDAVGAAAAKGGRSAVTLDPSLHGSVVAGELSVAGRAFGDKGSLPPRVTLVVNGSPLLSQTTDQPRFTLSRADLKPGDNTLELLALDDAGHEARSATHTVTLLGHPGPTPEARRDYRYFAADQAWHRGPVESIEHKQAGNDRTLAFYSNSAATVDLADVRAGAYALTLDAMGENFQGPPVAAVTLVVGDDRTSLGEVKADGNGFNDRAVGEVTLPDGPKSIEVAFINDAADKKAKKDRNLYVRSLRLSSAAAADTLGPAAVVRYPDDGHAAFGSDAVVVDVSDDHAVAWCQVLLDGQPTGGRVEAGEGRGRVLLPLVLRGVSPGEHRLGVQVADAAGHVVTTADRTFKVLDAAPGSPGEYEAAVRLLDRFAYGPEPRQLAAVLLEGPRDYLRRQLDRDADDPGTADAWRHAVGRHPNPQRIATAYLNDTPNPVRARLVMFIDNHFNTWPRKTGNERKAPEFARWITLGPAPFADLLTASATSPAMLVYLDQQRSSRNRINENYAREVMELHTLGVHGGYAQADVTELAHLLAGWGVTSTAQPAGAPGKAADTFAYAANRNDPAPRTVFGLRFDEAKDRAERFDRVRLALEMLAAHPATARFISRKLAAHYLTLNPDAADAFADDLAGVYQTSGGDLREVVAAIAASPVYAADSVTPRLSHPLTFATRLLRLADSQGDYLIYEFTRRSGFGVFDRETPDGYPEEDEAYADSNAMLQRWRLAGDLESNYYRLLPESLRNPPADAKGDAGAMAAWHQRVVDELAVRLTGRLLSERSNAAVLAVLADSELETWRLVRLAGTLVAQMPEVSLR